MNFSKLKSLLKPRSTFQPPAAGVYHFLEQENNRKSRIHLRVEHDGGGYMLVNANNLYFFNPTAIFMAYLSLQHLPDAQIIQAVCAVYDTEEAQAEQDFAAFKPIFTDLITGNEKCPICDLHLETLAPRTVLPLAPYRMDLALTYRCNNNCGHCYNARSRSFPEMTTQQWKQVLDRCWQAGIPHIVFTGGEPTLREDLPELIAYAENLGQITGINTNGRKLKDPQFVQRLVDAGLDHVQITFESSDSSIHDQMQGVAGAWQDTLQGIKNVVSSSLYMMTNTTMLRTNIHTIPQTLDLLAELKVPTVGLNALIHAGKGKANQNGLSEQEIEVLLDMAKEKTAASGQRLIWYTPTQYCHFNPILQQVGAKGCSAALYNMCIEPNGDVLPCQSYYQAVGNMLTDSWDTLWHHPLCESIRSREFVPAACRQCALLDECGGGCPLAYSANAYQTPCPIIDLFPEELELSRDEIPE